MASFVVHYIAGEKFLDFLGDMIKITDADRNNFRLGNLIVDGFWGCYCDLISALISKFLGSRRR